MQFTKWDIGRRELWAHHEEIGTGGSSASMFMGRSVCVCAWGEVPISLAIAPYKSP